MTRTERALQHVVASCPPELMVVVGYPRARGGQLFNTAGVIREGRVVAEYDKQCLPNYQVFDEKRYFSAGDSPCVVSFEGIQLGSLFARTFGTRACRSEQGGRRSGATEPQRVTFSPWQAGRTCGSGGGMCPR